MFKSEGERMTTSSINPALLDELLKGQDPKSVLSSHGLFGELKKALAERILNAEMDHHLSRTVTAQKRY
jgi:putative transposase